MLYIGIFTTIFALGSIALTVRIRQSLPSKHSSAYAVKACKKAIAHQEWERALCLIRPIIKANIGNCEAKALYAHILRSIHLPDQALEQANQGLSQQPKNLNLLKEKGKALLDLGQSQKALDALGQCSPVLQSESDYTDFATALFQTGRAELAWQTIQHYLHTSHSGSLFALAADICLAKQQFADAARYFIKAKHCGCQGSDISCKTAWALLQAGCKEQALQYFSSILEIDEQHVAATLGKGAVFEKEGNYKQALEIYQKGSAWDQANPHLLLQAGVAAMKIKEYEYAVIYLQAVKSKEAKSNGAKNSISPYLLACLAYSLESLERYSEAEAAWLDLVEQFPQHSAGYRGLAWLCGIGKNTALSHDEGVKMAKRAVEINPDHSAWELLSACQARVGNFDEAHKIQESLEASEQSSKGKLRRRSAMRQLRKKQPLDASTITASLVA